MRLPVAHTLGLQNEWTGIYFVVLSLQKEVDTHFFLLSKKFYNWRYHVKVINKEWVLI